MTIPVTFFAEVTSGEAGQQLVQIRARVGNATTDVLACVSRKGGESADWAAARAVTLMFDVSDLEGELVDLARRYDQHTHGGPE